MAGEDAQAPQFVGEEQVWQIIKGEPNLATQQLMARLLTAVMLEPHRSGDVPSMPVDLAFLMRASRQFLSSHTSIRAILDGEDLRWFPEDW